MKNLPENYNQTLLNLKERVKLAQYKSLSTVNSEMILMYLDFGKIFSEKLKSGWGDSIIDNISKDLQTEYVGVKGFSSRNLRRMKLIYEEICHDSNWTQAVSKIPWGHSNLILAKVKNKEERTFYLQKSLERGWSRSILEEEIKFDSFKKQLEFQNNFSKTLNENKLIEYRLEFKDEYNLSFLNLGELHTERDLENALVNNIIKTIGQLGNDFAFMGRQFRLELDDKEYFVDLLFFHRKLKSMIAIELKTTEFKPEHSQQLNWYLHLLDKTIKYPEDNQTIGILLCKTKSKITVEYALEMANNPIGVATYSYKQLPNEIAQFLPTEQEFERLLQNNENLD